MCIRARTLVGVGAGGGRSFPLRGFVDVLPRIFLKIYMQICEL